MVANIPELSSAPLMWSVSPSLEYYALISNDMLILFFGLFVLALVEPLGIIFHSYLVHSMQHNLIRNLEVSSTREIFDSFLRWNSFELRLLLFFFGKRPEMIENLPSSAIDTSLIAGFSRPRKVFVSLIELQVIPQNILDEQSEWVTDD